MRCLKIFTRAGHLKNHAGTNRCLLNRVRKKDSSKRGFSGSGNVRRTIQKNLACFVKYLRHKQRLEKQHPRKVQHVPLVGMAADVRGLRHCILQARRGKADRITPGDPQGLAACLMIATGWTVRLAEAIGLPNVPMVAADASMLKSKMLTMYTSQVQAYNVRMIACCCRSFLGLPPARARRAINRNVRLLAAICRKVHKVQSSQSPIDKHTSRFAWQKKLAIKGLPAKGYTLKLAFCLWTTLLSGTATGPEEELSDTSGVSKAIEELTSVKATAPADMTLRVRQIVSCLKECPHAPSSAKQLSAAQMAVHLCSWARDGYGETSSACPSLVAALRK